MFLLKTISKGGICGVAWSRGCGVAMSHGRSVVMSRGHGVAVLQCRGDWGGLYREVLCGTCL